MLVYAPFIVKREVIEIMNLQSKVLQLGSVCDERERVFAQLLFDGMSKEKAFFEVYGYRHNGQANKLLAGAAGDYLAALRLAVLNHAVPPIIIDKEDRLHLLTTIALQGAANYQVSGEATHAAQATKAINEINRMMGSHAPTEINVKGLIMRATLTNELSSSECTDIYKRMMEGAQLEAQPDEKVKDKMLQITRGGDT
jgi:hypothetical protein